jgi:hypothetical protein
MERAEHAAHINAAWQRGVDAIIETGRRIEDAKADLPTYGEYEEMVRTDLHFSRQTALKLRAIASNKVLSDAAHVRHLPPSWGTLSELAVIANKGYDLEAGIASGAIHPRMERKHVKALLSPPPQRDDDLEEPDREDDQPHEDEPAVNPLVVAWESASPEARRDFVRACWSEIIRAREEQVGAANGNGADHGTHPTRGNAEASDRWIEGDGL